MSKFKCQSFFGTPFALPPVGVDEFDGETYSKEEDFRRLKGQLEGVFNLMKDGEYRTLRQIADEIGCSEASASARLRDLRKPKFGSYVIDRKKLGGGLFEYAIKTEVGSGRDK